jgi:1-acyl-sn-glycerol-3-phosphate acyltransferase
MVKRTRQAYRAGGFVATTAVMLPLYLSHYNRVPDDQKDTVRELWVRRWARALLSLFSITTVVHGPVPPPTKRGDRGRLIIANHRSAIDIGVVLATFGGTMVSRADLSSWPLVGVAARSVGTVFVDRGSKQSGASTIRAIQKHLERGMTITVFAEGTTFDGDVVRPFYGGAFIAAARARAEILPVGLAYPAGSGAAFLDETFMEHLGRMAKSTATRMAVVAGTPILVEKGSKAGDLSTRTHAEVTRLVAEARKIAGP